MYGDGGVETVVEHPRRPPEPVEAELVRDGQAFAALEEEWEGLHGDAPRATLFQSWAWLYSWWEHYGQGDYGLRLMTIRDASRRLVGAAPFMLDSGGRLLFVGTGEANYLDVIARAGWERQVVETTTKALRALPGFGGVADLQDLRPSAVAWGLYHAWEGPKASAPQEGCPVVDLGDGGWDELLASLSKNLRSTVRRTVKKARKEGVRGALAGPEEAEEAARRLVALHRESWEGRDIAAEHLSRRWESYVVAAARRMTGRGLGAVSELRRGEEVLASQLLGFDREFDGFLVIGASQEALRNHQVSSLLLWDGIGVAIGRDARCFDMMQGGEPYKLRWCSRVVPKSRIVLGMSLASWLPYAGRHVVGARVVQRAKRYVKSEETPRWVEDAARSAVRRYKALNGTIRRS